MRINSSFKSTLLATTIVVGLLTASPLLTTSVALAASPTASQQDIQRITYKTVKVDGLNIFYREAGDPKKPTILLLHGFPTSSHMFRDLMPRLADKYHVVAPDYPGFGYSDVPSADEFKYTFDHLTDIVEGFTDQVGLKRYVMYVQDYGAPVGYRLATRHPERVAGFIVQNGNAYEEGLQDFWAPLRAYWKDPSDDNAAKLKDFLKLDGTKFQYLTGVRNPQHINPDAWTIPQSLLDRPGNQEIQLALFYDYGSNPPLYTQWQNYFRTHQPPMLIVWGKNDPIFPATGAYPYKRDLPKVETHLLDTGHFALEEDSATIARLIRSFMARNVH